MTSNAVLCKIRNLFSTHLTHIVIDPSIKFTVSIAILAVYTLHAIIVVQKGHPYSLQGSQIQRQFSINASRLTYESFVDVSSFLLVLKTNPRKRTNFCLSNIHVSYTNAKSN